MTEQEIDGFIDVAISDLETIRAEAKKALAKANP